MLKESIAIDGHSSSGKSTVADKLTESLKGYFHLNTGSMYRALAYVCLKDKIDVRDEKAVCDELIKSKIKVEFDGDTQKTYAQGKCVDSYLRAEEISKASSYVSVFRSVREKIVLLQREIAKKYNVVMEGRDITTEVLPMSKYKFFITATPNVRAQRRFEELCKKGESVDFEKILTDLVERDARDENREFGALKISPSATVIDTSNLTINDVVNIIIEKMRVK